MWIDHPNRSGSPCVTSWDEPFESGSCPVCGEDGTRIEPPQSAEEDVAAAAAFRAWLRTAIETSGLAGTPHGAASLALLGEHAISKVVTTVGRGCDRRLFAVLGCTTCGTGPRSADRDEKPAQYPCRTLRWVASGHRADWAPEAQK